MKKDFIFKKGITTIDAYAFANNLTLTHVVIPKSVVHIEEHAFFAASNLKTILFEEDSQLRSIGDYAFGQSRITDVVIPSSVQSIGYGAFAECDELGSITLPFVGKSRTAVKEEATFKYLFGAKTSEKQMSSVPNDLRRVIITDTTSIGDFAFDGLVFLYSIVLPTGVSYIGKRAFADTYNLRILELPSSVTSIGDEAFYGTLHLASLVIPKGITTINKGVFGYCLDLTHLVIPSSVTRIEDDAFNEASAFRQLVLPNNLTTIGNAAFANMYCLEKIIIPNSVVSMGDYAFYCADSLKQITLSSQITRIGAYAFAEAGSLTTIEIPRSVTSIGEYAFYKTTNLERILIPSSVTHIGQNAFLESNHLTIYAEAKSKPLDWDSNWNPGNQPVIWGYIGN